jgi:hypothetical protein
MTLEFVEFDKIARLNREVVITEKIDGSNAQVHIRVAAGDSLEHGYDCQVEIGGVAHYLRAGSRNRWIAHVGSDDLNGFGRWAYQNAHELAALGAGAHFGEWWGAGIQRKYGLSEKRWSLFNVARWVQHDDASAMTEKQQRAPKCCHVVPIIAQGIGMEALVDQSIGELRNYGSRAAPGFMQPEGIVVFHTASRNLFKVTLEKDSEPKSRSAA